MLPPALIAAIPVGASTICFFLVTSQTYFRKVDLPVPAFPVRNTDLTCILDKVQGILKLFIMGVYLHFVHTFENEWTKIVEIP